MFAHTVQCWRNCPKVNFRDGRKMCVLVEKFFEGFGILCIISNLCQIGAFLVQLLGHKKSRKRLFFNDLRLSFCGERGIRKQNPMYHRKH